MAEESHVQNDPDGSLDKSKVHSEFSNSNAELEAMNAVLEKEITRRRKAEEKLNKLNGE